MTQEVKLKRVQCNYQTENARFLLECDFSKQYNNYYRKRLEKTRPYLEYNARSKWDPTIPIYDLAEVATFSLAESLDDSDLGASPPRMTPPRSQTGERFEELGTPSGGGYHKFPKRMRRMSSNSGTIYPQTSTQSEPQNEKSDLSDILASPIEATSNIPETPRVRKATNSSSAQCIVIGTLFKRMKLQPDVVEELSKGDFHVKCERYLGHYTSQDDTLVLEDTEESISLIGNFSPKNFVTGICVALLGYSIDDGSQFLVRDICYAEPNRQILYDDSQLLQMCKPGAPISSTHDGRPIYLMVVSGLGFHHEMEKKSALTHALQDMIDFVWGGGKFSADERSHRVARILVIGDSLHEDRLALGVDDDDEMGIDPDDIVTKMKRSRQVKQYTRSICAVKHMDDFFAQLSKTINVDVMPGPSDPSSHLLPQQPFHPCMFPKSCMFSTFNCTTNPHHAIYNDDIELLATSGQNVDIIKRFSGLQDPIEIMKNHLKWGNSAPSAPDNLYSVPYEDEDPYVIDFIPDIYIASCQGSYQTDYYYYTSNQPSQPVSSQHTSFQSTRTESTVMNVTPESVRARTTRTSGKHTPSSPFNESVLFELVNTPTPTLAGEPSPIISVSRPNSQPSSYVPNQLALQRDASLSLPVIPKKSRTLLMTVPKFHESFSCVLINLENLESQEISFK